MVKIEAEKCVGCGLCVKDCPAGNLSMKNGKAAAGEHCFLCGHCVALCPQGAVTLPEYDMTETEPCRRPSFSAEEMLLAIKSRRSIRDYQPRPIPREQAETLIQAGRYAATAKNLQGCRFLFVQEQLPRLRELIWDGIGRALASAGPEDPIEAYRLFYDARQKDRSADYLFRNAPAVLFIACERELDAGLAAQCVELQAYAMGIGALYNGYLRRAAQANPAALQFLDPGEKPLAACMLLGYPNVRYMRTVPRRAADVRYL